jgi:hypothetical protein
MQHILFAVLEWSGGAVVDWDDELFLWAWVGKFGGRHHRFVNGRMDGQNDCSVSIGTDSFCYYFALVVVTRSFEMYGSRGCSWVQ